MFPALKAELSVYSLSATETQVELRGHYDPPMGVLGGALDAVGGIALQKRPYTTSSTLSSSGSDRSSQVSGLRSEPG